MRLPIPLADLWRLAREAFDGWLEDFAPSMGAALAYYTMFSIAPLLVIVIAVAGLAFGEQAAQGHLLGQLEGMVGHDGATAIQGLLASVHSKGTSVVATAVGVVALLIGATTVFGELQSDLDRIWKAPRAARPSGLWGLLRARLLSFGLILGIGFILLVSLVVSAMLAALGDWWAPYLAGWSTVLQAVNFVVSLAIVTLLFALIYKVLPSVQIAWRDVWIGAAATAALFTLGKYLIGLYIGRSGVVSGFGAAGSIAVLLLWVYYSAQIFLLGAEFTYAYAHDCGSLCGKKVRGRTAHGALPGAASGAAPSSAGGGSARAIVPPSSVPPSVASALIVPPGFPRDPSL